MTPVNVLRLSLFAAVLAWSTLNVESIAVMSLDLGSQFLKVAIVKPGVPMEIALNTESRRKTPHVVSLKSDERLFSDPAAKVAVMNPDKAYVFLTHLIGKQCDSEAVNKYKARFPHANIVKDEERGTVLFKADGDKIYSVEQLLGMIFNSTRQIAEKFADHPMKDAVVTVPAFFNQAERRAVLEAANLTGLNVLQLMNDNAAVALNYGIFRTASINATAQYVMFFDMGASHTTASIVEYSTTKVKDRGYLETVPQLVMKGVGYDTTLGGLEMDFRLRDHLAKIFKDTVKTKGDITSNKRSMAKLLKESQRVRQVLSANTKTRAQVEGLFEEKDFRADVTREQIDEMCSDLYPRVEKVIKMALSSSGIPKSEIESVILMGGVTRSPKIQEILKSVMGKEDLAKNINTDEAAALGSVYKAADLAKGFKVKRFLIKDLNNFPIDVSFERGETAKAVTRNLFSRMNSVPQRKVMTFNKKHADFSFNISYGDMSFLGEELKEELKMSNISTVKLTEIGDAHEKNSKATPKGVKAYFHMDESAILHLEKVEVHFEKSPELVQAEEKENESTLSKIGSTLSSFFGNEEKEKDAETEKVSEDSKPQNEEKKAEEPKVDEKAEKPKEKEEKKEDDKSKKNEEKPSDPKPKVNVTEPASNSTSNKTEPAKPKLVKVEVGLKWKHVDRLPLEEDVFKKASTVLDELEARDIAKLLRAKTMNDFESYVVSMRGQVTEDDISKLMSEEESKNVNEKLDAAYNWFDEDGWDADTETLKKKLKELKKDMEELQYKLKEAEARPKAIQALLGSLNMTHYFLQSYKQIPDHQEIFKEKDITDIVKLANTTGAWLMDTWKKQNETASHLKPVLLSSDLSQHQGKLDRELAYLMNKVRYYVPKPKPKPPVNSTKATNNATNTKPKASSNETKEEDLETPVNDNLKTDNKSEKAEEKEETKSQEDSTNEKVESPSETENKPETPKSSEEELKPTTSTTHNPEL